MNRFDVSPSSPLESTEKIMPAIQRGIQEVLNNRLPERGRPEHPSPPLASVSLLLGTGGDGRIWPDPITRRNRYGTLATPADREISFSSTTANNVSAEGFLAASVALERLFDIEAPFPTAFDQWFADIRNRIVGNLGCSGAKIILAASGTDAELLAICMFAGFSKRPVTNILVAPDETGSGVLRAAAGCHYSDFTALGSTVEAGAPLDGLSRDRIEVRTIAIRNDTGEPRHQHEIDAELIAVVELELARDRDVLVHVLDTSKTGLAGVTRQAARHVAALAPGRVQVIVDACQFRCSISLLQQDIADGFVVAVTGSKFVGGPPFSGALIVPSALADEIATKAHLPEGLSDYTAAQDWPASLRQRMNFPFSSEFNLGLGLRWVAALANLDRISTISSDQQFFIKSQFVGLVRSRIESLKGISLETDDDGDHLNTGAIVPFTVTDHSGSFASLEQSQNIHLLMRNLNVGPTCHVGQAVRLGRRTVLRIAASAMDVVSVAASMEGGQSLRQALMPIEGRLDAVFHKLSAVLHSLRDF
jgi:hypothetical protein